MEELLKQLLEAQNRTNELLENQVDLAATLSEQLRHLQQQFEYPISVRDAGPKQSRY